MISRRRFLQSSLSVALVPLLPRVALSQDLRVRQSWEAFCAGTTYTSFCNAIGLMRANHDETSPASWAYWANVHSKFCPHGKPYFLAWHRGLLYRFEGWLRRVSGDPGLILPYWNYYATPQVPPEFLDDTLPLYRADRTGYDVTGALSLDPFADTIIHFKRGTTDAFEPLVESRPHNPVHNLIGGRMSSILYSPLDPLFWVHHANIDRLWAAWFKAGDGRRQPADSNTYWSGEFQYGAAIKNVPAVWTSTTSRYLAYQYDDETLPASVPTEPPPSSSTAAVTTFSLAAATPLRPAASQSLPLGSARPLVLDEHSTSVDIALSATDASRIRSALLKPAATGGDASEQAGTVRVVLDGVSLTGLGDRGGYFYKVYINLPEQPGVSQPERTYLLGMVGPFEIGVAQMKMRTKGQGMQDMQDMAATHGGARLVFPATEALRRTWPSQLDKLSVSFVRVNGSARPAKGDVIKVKAFSVEADPAR